MSRRDQKAVAAALIAALRQPERGICGGCGRAIGLRLTDGMIRVHGAHHAPACPGSKRPPVPAPKTKTKT